MGNSPSVFLLDLNTNSRAILKSYLEELDCYGEIKSYDDYKIAFEEIKKFENPIVFVDISEITSELMEIVRNIRLYTTKMVITSTDYTMDSVIKAMRLGAKEFLPKPIIKEDLKHVIRTLFIESDDADVSSSKIITIYSNKGGIGKTTIASNLAMELSKVTRDKVALVDLNLQLGDISTFLNLNPAFDVGYVMKNIIDKKEASLINAFEKYQDSNVYVLSDPSYIEQAESITPYQIDNLFKALRKLFPYIVVDMSSNIDQNSLKILDESDLVIFTTIVNLPAIRNCQRCLNLFRSRRYSNGKVKVVINRYMENDEIKIEDIESTIGEKIYWKIPNNYFSIMEAINRGITVGEVNSNSNIANSFRDLANKISDDIVQQTLVRYRGSR